MRIVVTLSDGEPVFLDVRTFDHSKEWDRAVLTGYREFVLPWTISGGRLFKVTVYHLDPGVWLQSLRFF